MTRRLLTFMVIRNEVGSAESSTTYTRAAQRFSRPDNRALQISGNKVQFYDTMSWSWQKYLRFAAVVHSSAR